VLSCCVLAEGEQGGGKSVTARKRACVAAGGESGSVHSAVLYIPHIYIVVVTVPFVCCSVKLPLSRPTNFCLFPSILLPTPVVVMNPCCLGLILWLSFTCPVTVLRLHNLPWHGGQADLTKQLTGYTVSEDLNWRQIHGCRTMLPWRPPMRKRHLGPW